MSRCQIKEYCVNVWLTEKQYDKLKRYCEVKSFPLSVYVRGLILEAVKDFEKED